jgi:hypothetical protein
VTVSVLESGFLWSVPKSAIYDGFCAAQSLPHPETPSSLPHQRHAGTAQAFLSISAHPCSRSYYPPFMIGTLRLRQRCIPLSKITPDCQPPERW